MLLDTGVHLCYVYAWTALGGTDTINSEFTVIQGIGQQGISVGCLEKLKVKE